jgi:hypothetical protein
VVDSLVGWSYLVTVVLAFDADAQTNPIVARAQLECARAILKTDLHVAIETWDAADGKGLDDLLAAGKQPKLIKGPAALEYAERIAKEAGSSVASPSPRSTNTCRSYRARKQSRYFSMSFRVRV